VLPLFMNRLVSQTEKASGVPQKTGAAAQQDALRAASR
jgi:hypothetical protein